MLRQVVTKKFYRQGTYVSGAAQGYLIDKKTADKYKITNIAQLKDPKFAALFDADGNGKADLAGVTPVGVVKPSLITKSKHSGSLTQ